MSDRPILFSGTMVRAILREVEAPGTGKTQTRRLLKLPTQGIYEHPKMGGWTASTIGGKGCYLDPAMTIPAPERACIWHQTTGTTILPPYAPGDRLWVRETWAAGACANGLAPSCLHPAFWLHDNGGLWYAADEAEPAHPVTPKGPNRPGIHMPRWASRLTLHVTNVRVQRLQEISEADARAEGIEPREIRPVHDIDQPAETWWFGTENGRASAKSAFRDLWDSLNAERAPWASNPWVVAVSFRPVLGSIDRVAA